MPTIEERLHQAIRDFGEECRIPEDPNDLCYRKDEFDTYWVTAEVPVSPFDLYPNPNPAYSVWECEDHSKAQDWSDVSDWRRNEIFRCESDDDAGSNAKRLAHDRAKYLRKHSTGMLYAVRPSSDPPRLLPAPKQSPAAA
jgi:hypothetical protein